MQPRQAEEAESMPSLSISRAGQVRWMRGVFGETRSPKWPVVRLDITNQSPARAGIERYQNPAFTLRTRERYVL